MAAPQLTVQQAGQGVVTSDYLNGQVQSCDTIAQLRAFIGVQGVQVYVRGSVSPGDGGGGNYYWVSNAQGTDNGTTVIVPTGASSGYWSQLQAVSSTYQVPLTGFSLQMGVGVRRLILNPAGTLAAGTVTLPATPIDNQTAYVSTTQIITAFTISPSAGASISNAVTTLTAGQTVGYIYVAGQATWFRVQ